MACARLKSSILIAMISFAASAAHAADYAPPPQCYDAGLIASGRAPYGAVPCYVPPPPVVEEFSSWYLRGDIGFSNQSVGSIFNSNYSGYTSVANVDRSFDSAPFFGVGVGYNYNDWLRFDITAEYRGRANFHGFDVGYVGAASSPDRYTGSKSEWTFLFNAYADLGTWSGFTPFVGAGVGTSRNTISSFGDTSVHTIGGTQSDAYANAMSKWSFAWALYAGVGYKVTKNVTIELAYRYLDLGSASSGDLIGYDGTNNIYNPTEFRHLTSQDLKLGLRFNFDAFETRSPTYYAPAPVYQAPPPVYQPAPVYVQPPLRSKG